MKLEKGHGNHTSHQHPSVTSGIYRRRLSSPAVVVVFLEVLKRDTFILMASGLSCIRDDTCDTV